MNNQDNEKVFQKSQINWYPGHMAKAKRELKENMQLIDIIYEVIDARMPISSKIIDIDEITTNKPKILVVSKYDICDKQITDKILETYKNYTIIKIDLIKGNTNILISKTKEILNNINNERMKKGLKPRKARVAVIGVPNVGKSTLINKLVGKKVAQTGNTPGVTKSLGWTRINSDIELLDSPGILWPKLENQENAKILAALSSIKEEILDQEQIARFIISKMEELYPDKLINRYKLDKIDRKTIYNEIALKRGLLLKGGVPDFDKVYKTIINDLKDGRFESITLDRI